MSLTFLHPHIETTVVDNSFVFETATGGGTALYTPYFSDKGKDNEIELVTSLSTFLAEKGNPNFKKHGQAIYNVINWLRGGGRVYGMRLMPDDAAYSNSVLVVKTKAVQVPVYKKRPNGTYEKDKDGNRIPEMSVGENPVAITKAGVDIKLDIMTFPALYSTSTLLAQIEQITDTDADGYKVYPLGAFVLKGRGEYGNKYSYRLTLNTTLEDTYDFRIYDFSVLERTRNGNMRLVEGPFQVSLFPEAISLGGNSLFINQVIKDYCKEIEFAFSEKGYDALIDSIMEATKNEDGDYTIESPQELDFLFGYNKLGELQEEFNLENNTIALDHFEGIVLESGTDGAFSSKNPIADVIKAKEQALVSAFMGLTSSAVLNKKQFPFDVVLDANFPVAAKQAMADFAKERKDLVAITDTGILASPASAVAWRANSFQEDSYFCSNYGQSFTVYDSFTSSDIPVTLTYFLANKIPFNDNQYGIHYPIAGPTRGTITGFKTLDWNPNEYEKEDLYKARVNYVEQDFRSTKIMSQLTTQAKTSSLSNLNNVRVLLRMVRSIEELSGNYYFEFPDQNTLNNFNANIDNILSEWTTNGACSYAKGTVYQTEYDKEMKTARVRIEVAFNNVIERILIEFNIGK